MPKHTTRPKSDDPESDVVWNRTRSQNIVRNSASGKYYARFRLNGKLVWRALKTTSFTTAQQKLGKVIEAEKQLAAAGDGQITFAQAAKIFLDRNDQNPALKVITRQYHAGALNVIGKLLQRGDAVVLKYYWTREPKERFMKVIVSDVRIRDLTKDDCLTWAGRCAKEYSATLFNHALGIFRKIIAIGIEFGARFDNPAHSVKRLAVRAKVLQLPEPAQFRRFISAIEESGSGWSKPCADMVRFLAYGGFRLSEARNVGWSDVNLDKGEIVVRGAVTGLKGRGAGEVRRVPIIPDMKDLLLRLKAGAKDDARVLSVGECQRAMDSAAKKVRMARITHHDLRHLFATRCIESGVDIPTVARWMGHKDGGALAMRIYGHLRDAHSQTMASKVVFD